MRFDQPLAEAVFGEYLAPSRGAARAPRPPRRADRRAGRSRAVGGDGRPVAVPARRRHADRASAWSPRSATSPRSRIPSSWPATSAWSRPSGPPATERRQGSITKAGSTPRPAAAGRGRLALPPPATRLADAPAPPGRPAARRDRRRVARAAAAAPPLGAPRRGARQEAHHRRGRRRPRARVLRLGDRPTNPTDRLTTTRSRWGWRPARATRDPRSGYEHQPRLARSILDRGPGARSNRHEVASPRISA